MIRNSLPRRLAAVFASAMFAAAALGGVDVDVGPNASVKGTIAPSGETEVVRFEATAGVKLSFTVSATKTGASDVTATLAFRGEPPLDLASAKKLTVLPRKFAVTQFVLPDSGPYALRVTAAGTGAYSLTLTAPARRSERGTLAIDAGGFDTFRFGALAGSRVTITAKSAKKSVASPRLGIFDGTDLTNMGKATAKSHVVKGLVLATTKDYSLDVNNVAAANGAIDVTIAITPPATKLRKFDVRGVDGAGTNVQRFVDAASGGEVVVEDASGPLNGCVVTVPPGALAADAQIVVATAAPAGVADPQTQQPAGPTVTLGPAGTTFATPVTVRLPFDPGAFPVGSDPAATLLVVRRETDGTTTQIKPSTVDVAGKTCEFLTSGFSSFLPVAPVGPANLAGRSYWMWRLASVYENSVADSRAREIRLQTAIADFDGAGNVALNGQIRVAAVTHVGSQAGQIVGQVTTHLVPLAQTLTWQSTGVLDPAVSVGGDQLGVADDGAILCGNESSGFDLAPDLQLFLQRPAFPPTASQLQGLWWIGTFSFEPAEVPNAPARVTMRRMLGTLDLRAGGVARRTTDEQYWYYDSPRSQIVDDTAHAVVAGTYSVADASAGVYAGAVDVSTGGTTWRLVPSRSGQILAGTESVFANGVVSLVVAVRQGAGMSADDMQETYTSYGLEIDPYVTPYAIDGVQVGDWSSVVRRETRWCWGANGFDYRPNSTWWIERDGGDLQVRALTSIRVDNGEFSLTPAGQYRTLEYDVDFHAADMPNLVGGVTPDRAFAFAMRDPTDSHYPFGMRLSVRMRPHESSPPWR